MSDDKKKKYIKSFRLYKAKKDGSGSASQWDLASGKDCVFLEMADQTGKDDSGNAKFDWGNKIRFKMGESDIGEILAVLAGVNKAVGPLDSKTQKYRGLFHSNDSGNAILKFGELDSGMFAIRLSVKRDGNQSAVQHTITKGEACVLGTLLRRAIEVMYDWH